MKYFTSISILLFLSACFLINCTNESSETEEKSQWTKEDSIQRGEYLALVGHCDDCHTPKKMTEQGPVPDMDKRFMGFQAGRPVPAVPESQDWVYMSPDLLVTVGPWGTTYSANITPDDTGIGSWTFEQFSNSLTKGMHKGLPNGRPVLPPMPWPNTAKLTEQDLQALFDYLQTVKPIENQVPSAELAPKM